MFEDTWEHRRKSPLQNQSHVDDSLSPDARLAQIFDSSAIERNGVEIEFATLEKELKTLLFKHRPVGFHLDLESPGLVSAVRSSSIAEQLGVKIGWRVHAIGNDVAAKESARRVGDMLQQATQHLQPFSHSQRQPFYGFQEWHAPRLKGRLELAGLGGVQSAARLRKRRVASVPTLPSLNCSFSSSFPQAMPKWECDHLLCPHKKCLKTAFMESGFAQGGESFSKFEMAEIEEYQPTLAQLPDQFRCSLMCQKDWSHRRT